MEEKLQVRIEADIKNFQQGMNQVENNLKRAEGIFQSSSKSAFQLENAITQLSKEYKQGAVSNNEYSARIAHLNSELTKQRSNVGASAREVERLNKLMTTNQLQKVATANTNVSKSFHVLGTNIKGSNQVAFEFNRIIQDAPFGIMGIGNNIQQLAGNFSNLSKNAGGTVPAIKAAMSAMITGPNLALLAISALTAGFTAYNMGVFDFLSSNKEAKKSLEDLKKESEDYVNSLNAIAKSQVTGQQSAQAQITSLRLLYERTQDVTLSEDERLKAVKELQKVYPQVFGNLNQEIILNGQAQKSYEDLATSILATAKARAAEDTLVENEKQLIALNRERAQVLEDIAKREAEATKATERFRQAPGSLTPQYQTADQQIATAELEAANRLREREIELAKQINSLTKDNAGLTQEYANAQSEVVVEVDKTVEKVGSIGTALKAIEPVEVDDLFIIDYTKLQKEIEAGYNAINEGIKTDGKVIDIPVKMDFTTESLTGDAAAENDAIVEQWKQRMEVIKDFGSQMQNTLAGAFENAFSSGENFFESVVDGFKKMLAQLAAQLAASAVIKVLGMIIGGPAGAAIAGGASGGIGSLVGGLFGGGAGMRIGQTPSLGVPSTGVSSAGYKVDVNVQGVVRGNDLYLANQRGNRNNDRYF